MILFMSCAHIELTSKLCMYYYVLQAYVYDVFKSKDYVKSLRANSGSGRPSCRGYEACTLGCLTDACNSPDQPGDHSAALHREARSLLLLVPTLLQCGCILCVRL